ncbi:alkaline phosphatase family protein [Agrilutibacter solisilvae]|uniref:Alkaline phosphatase family protein n=1 Tax=Agrilutibacter solisilvae TaxID=2763317 RepID=A0A975AQH3_9GAMM|nr:ectonucleotide pyrophosphatase/phosphodiesterase [Lysobacter solisilvae]QSX76954.1 alkaline phosphatase family protein [Lysobacter solisilvae]
MNAFRFLSCLAAVLLAACATPSAIPSRTAPDEPPSLLLVSIDGFRADYLGRDRTPQLARLAREGVHARWMVPSYPSLTFPNHYSIVTGLRPDRHGIVHNLMSDPALGRFGTSRPQAVSDARWWGGEPIWVTAAKAGLPTATLFWPGSEAAIGGVRPSRWTPYDADLPPEARVDTVLRWLSEPAATRPRLATLYFGEVDSAGHHFGPESAQVDNALSRTDQQIGRMLRELNRRGLRDRVNLVIVSDHGMAQVRRERVLAIESLVDPADALVIHYGEVLGFLPIPGREASVQARLLGRHRGYECWKKDELPARWHYGSHPRIPPIVCQMEVGWMAIPRERIDEYPPGATRGAHGFDPQSPQMRAIFIADGPAFADGVELPPIDNVDVYPLLARLLGVPPADNDGDIAHVEPALREP